MNKLEFTEDEINCAYCVYHNPIMEEYFKELGYEENEQEGLDSFNVGSKILEKLREKLDDDKILKLFKQTPDVFESCIVVDGDAYFKIHSIK